jgi:hypothetical protein
MNFVHERDVEIETESIGDLLRDLRDEVMVMFRQQLDLARAETNEKISSLSKNTGFLFAGSLILFTGFLFLITGLTFLGYQGLLAAGLSAGIAMWLMPLITAVIVGGIGAILVFRSINTFKHTSFTPNKTLHSFKEDQQWITGMRK